MIDLPTQKEMNSPHHRRAVWALIAAGLLLGVVIVGYYLRSYNDVQMPLQDNEVRASIGQPVPPANLTDAELAKLKTLVGKPVPPANLTAAQLERLRMLQGK